MIVTKNDTLKISKLKNVKGKPDGYGNLQEYYKGFIVNLPTVGHSFSLYGDHGILTSPVTEIIEDNNFYIIFKTLNSIYKLEHYNNVQNL